MDIVGKIIKDRVRMYKVLDSRSRHCTEKKEYLVQVVSDNRTRWVWEETVKSMFNDGTLEIVG